VPIVVIPASDDAPPELDPDEPPLPELDTAPLLDPDDPEEPEPPASEDPPLLDPDEPLEPLLATESQPECPEPQAGRRAAPASATHASFERMEIPGAEQAARRAWHPAISWTCERVDARDPHERGSRGIQRRGGREWEKARLCGRGGGRPI